jgi:hypothetical protein
MNTDKESGALVIATRGEGYNYELLGRVLAEKHREARGVRDRVIVVKPLPVLQRVLGKLAEWRLSLRMMRKVKG